MPAKTKSTSKIKRPSLPSLITKADNLASKYIRQKFADSSGNVTCITCGKVDHYKNMHAAHYIERAAKNTRWLEENLHPACPSCNVYRKEFHKREYTLYLSDMYGREKIDELKTLGRQVLSGSQVRQLAEEAIAYFSDQLQALQS